MASVTNGEMAVVTLSGVTGATSFSVPAGMAIAGIVVNNTTANAVTGGLKFGTTSGATDIVVALAVVANALLGILDSAILKRAFSTSVAQTVFVDAVVAWNSASVNISVHLVPFV